MKKVAVISLFLLVFALLYFRAEHPRSHFSKYDSNDLSKIKDARDPASSLEKKKP